MVGYNSSYDDGGDHPLRTSVNSLLPLYDRVRARYEVLKKDEITKRWPALQGLPEDVVGLFDPDVTMSRNTFPNSVEIRTPCKM